MRVRLATLLVFTTDNSAQGGKWVELLKEIAPHTARMALLFNPETAAPSKFFMPSVQAAASAFAVQASVAPVHTKGEIEGVIAAQALKPGGGNHRDAGPLQRGKS